MNFEEDYMALVNGVIEDGDHRETRAGPTVAKFGTMLTISCLEDGLFPILTTRKMYPKGVWGELTAFIAGSETVADFKHFGCNYWDANAAAWDKNKGKAPAEHRVGKIYGGQWRDFNGVDQLRALITSLTMEPSSRRHLLTTYNPAETQLGCLPPCHLLAQFNIRDDAWLECCVYMRSVDLILGLPSDIMLYASLLIQLANDLDLYPGYLTFMMGDTHVYLNHVDQWYEQAERIPRALPSFNYPDGDIWDFHAEAIRLDDYNPHEKIPYEFNV